MQLLENNSEVMTKTRELCDVIVKDAEYQQILAKIETFLNNDEARLSYQSVHEKGQELNQKQQSGLELGPAEIGEFETARESLLANPIASEFMEAQQNLETLQKSVSQYVGMTLELGRVPTEEDIAQLSSGGGCGC